MDQVYTHLQPAQTFAKDSVRLVKRCTKPDRKGEKLLFCFRCVLLVVSYAVY